MWWNVDGELHTQAWQQVPFTVTLSLDLHRENDAATELKTLLLLFWQKFGIFVNYLTQLIKISLENLINEVLEVNVDQTKNISRYS